MVLVYRMLVFTVWNWMLFFFFFVSQCFYVCVRLIKPSQALNKITHPANGDKHNPTADTNSPIEFLLQIHFDVC